MHLMMEEHGDRAGVVADLDRKSRWCLWTTAWLRCLKSGGLDEDSLYDDPPDSGLAGGWWWRGCCRLTMGDTSTTSVVTDDWRRMVGETVPVGRVSAAVTARLAKKILREVWSASVNDCWRSKWQSYRWILLLLLLNFMVRTDRHSPTGFLVHCSAQTSPLFVVE